MISGRSRDDAWLTFSDHSRNASNSVRPKRIQTEKLTLQYREPPGAVSACRALLILLKLAVTEQALWNPEANVPKRCLEWE
jgi:hypothetical protein